MLNHRGDLLDGRVEFTAAAARTAGVPVLEQGWACVPEVDAASGASYTGRISGEFEIDEVASAAVGSPVYLTEADNTITITAGVGKRLIGRVTRIDSQRGVIDGKMWFLLYSNQGPAA